MPHVTDVQLEAVPSFSLALDRTANDLSSETTDHLVTGAMSLGSAVCKLENEEFGTVSYPLGSDPAVAESKGSNELVLPMQNILEEPINLSVKKPQLCASPPICITNSSYMRPSNPPLPRHIEDCHNCEEEHFETEIESNQNNRACAKEVKVPYVRLERLKICTSESGELPVFKLQPQKNEHDGTFLLIIECGTQSSRMAIKVNQGHSPNAKVSQGNPPNKGLNAKPEKRGDQRIPSSQPTEQALPPPVDHRLSNSLKKAVLPQEDSPIENEDFCAVCLNGGELLCCDYCPKVYHLSCHVPALLSFPVGEWVCTLCRNVEKPEVEYDCENTRYGNTLMRARAPFELDDYDQKARHYYQIIKRPMDLSTIREKLQKKSKFHYSTSEELVADVRLMFWNCATFNYPDSEVAEAGRCLEIFFESKLKDIYPEKHFSLVQQDDSDSEEVEHENSQVSSKGFHWPSYRQECIQPKRRRRHAVRMQKQKHLSEKRLHFMQV
ncbi:UNVERIFIED_CONTAM: hypothetical protein K2H54_059121 [Gekko kuhli]